MKSHALFTNTPSTTFSNPNYQLKQLLINPKSSSFSPFGFLNRTCFLHFHPLRLPAKSNFKIVEGVRFDAPVMAIDEVVESEDGDLVVETCITRTLPPALTLEHGLQSIKEAVDKLKLDPPSSTSGVLRFQIAVPPSAKALSWFCCQPESSGVFPIFFLSKEMGNPTCKSLYLNQTRGVFGIGTAICFTYSSSCAQGERKALKRFILNDSVPVTTYGFMDTYCDTKSSSMKHEAGSFYFLIPEIELNEHEDTSILTATLAWSNPLHCTFEQALQSYECSFYQASYHFWPATERYNSRYIKSALRKLNVVEDKTVQMVCINAVSLARTEFGSDSIELKGACLCQFSFKFAPTVGVSSNMLEHASEMNYSMGDHANINAVWASLLIEECSRLGLTYFCIAPGSRSSHLAVAASTHPLTTCIACFDERSLAFHAVGYARGSHKPAVIITSSGTAVSNLLPAVVEASQDFVPVLLLTADRPPELQDVGANQSINQVNHFGSFVRFFFSLPTPTDEIPARMVLTTLDSAVHWATSSPYGPVHINCPFREPLDSSPKIWSSSCLKGLDIWMSSSEPFTKYIQVQHCHAWMRNACGQMAEVLELIQGVNRGLLLVGAMHTEDEMWAALLLAKHLLWPVVADILSGLRFRKLLASFPEIEENLLFLDHLDHALLSESVKGWMHFDVVIQIGSRFTSKRISQMLEECFPCSYILVDNHPYRQDPAHFVTHRIQSTIIEFADSLLKVQVPHRRSKWCSYLQAVEMMVAWEISFQICANCSLSEPYVAHVLSKALTSDSALFVGNSMAIRDADMYGRSWITCSHTTTDMMLNSDLPYHCIWVAGSRGASGIDGLLSTAVGFSIGCNKQVLGVVGDVSFLHDTNGLAILKQRKMQKPILILVINNHGGAIFSLLPIADGTEPRILNQYFYATHEISIHKLCIAHGVKHLQVKTKIELEDALITFQRLGTDCVIEVESCINANAAFHSTLRKFACQAADHAVNTLSRLSIPDSISYGFSIAKIDRMEYTLYRIQLCAPPTSSSVKHDQRKFYREGFILSLYLEDGSVGYGEVAPLEVHQENLLDVEEQLRFLLHVMKGANISCFLPLLRGSFSSWIWKQLGIPVCSIFPSVRCGLEMAILNAIAVKHNSSFLNILPKTETDEGISNRSSSVMICALVDCNGTPAEVANIAMTLVEEGFTAIKLKVARRADPSQDAAVIQEVRKKVGHQIELRVDANRKWTYEKALEFSNLVKNCDLQYIEEPVQDENDIIKYCEESGLPVALDETINKFQKNPFNSLEKYANPGIVAVVIKPSVIGGFENAASIAKWAQQQRKMAVVSSAFESGLGLSAYVLFSCYLELQNADLCKAMNHELAPPVAHGLGTYQWLKEDVTSDPIGICYNPCSGLIEASVANATRLLQNFHMLPNIIRRTFIGEQLLSYQLTVKSKDVSSCIKVQEIGKIIDDNVLIFFHGFLGTGEEWIPIMKAISGSARCISIDLPGHGGSKIQNYAGNGATRKPVLSIDVVADVLCKLVEQITPKKVTLVGYSMGARIALYMAHRFSCKIKGAVIISGSPGLKDTIERKIRRAKDDSRGCCLVAHGLQMFVDGWYTGELWKSLRMHPHFNQIVSSRLQHDDVESLSRSMSDLSIGRQPSLWEELKQCNTPLLLIVGEKDGKFKAIAQKMYSELSHGKEGRDDPGNKIHEMVQIPNCGHAVHLENPLPVIRAVRQFLSRLR